MIGDDYNIHYGMVEICWSTVTRKEGLRKRVENCTSYQVMT